MMMTYNDAGLWSRIFNKGGNKRDNCFFVYTGDVFGGHFSDFDSFFIVFRTYSVCNTLLNLCIFTK
jgi:hypothetical protein